VASLEGDLPGLAKITSGQSAGRTEAEAKAYVDYLYSTLYKYATEKIHQSAFIG
jgi:hypothetical protein